MQEGNKNKIIVYKITKCAIVF